jgi:hypothetical protein
MPETELVAAGLSLRMSEIAGKSGKTRKLKLAATRIAAKAAPTI